LRFPSLGSWNIKKNANYFNEEAKFLRSSDSIAASIFCDAANPNRMLQMSLLLVFLGTRSQLPFTFEKMFAHKSRIDEKTILFHASWWGIHHFCRPSLAIN
jgi:hypothetical protein